MALNEPDDLSGFVWRQFEGGEIERGVLVSEEGADPVILIHELPAITPQVMVLARQLVSEGGFRVYLPSLLGAPGEVPGPLTGTAATIEACVRSELRAALRGDRTRAIVPWLRSLAALAKADGPGTQVGMVGLCLSGGFALAAATDPSIGASVACEPSLPLLNAHDVDIAPEDQLALTGRMRSGELAAMLFRFQGDKVSPCERVGRLDAILTGEFRAACLPDSSADTAYRSGFPNHSVMTNHLIDRPGELTLSARTEMIQFLAWRLRGDPEPKRTPGIRDCLQSGCAKGAWRRMT